MRVRASGLLADRPWSPCPQSGRLGELGRVALAAARPRSRTGRCEGLGLRVTSPTALGGQTRAVAVYQSGRPAGGWTRAVDGSELRAARGVSADSAPCQAFGAAACVSGFLRRRPRLALHLGAAVSLVVRALKYRLQVSLKPGTAGK